jgi:hypothetical protein
LKPGGYSIQSINLDDHLALYDANVCPKNYLRYSDKVWTRFFENGVQYINRIQRPGWLQLFRKAGLELAEEIAVPTDIDSIKVHKTYEHLEESDLKCFNLVLIHKKSDPGLEGADPVGVRVQRGLRPQTDQWAFPCPKLPQKPGSFVTLFYGTNG